MKIQYSIEIFALSLVREYVWFCVCFPEFEQGVAILPYFFCMLYVCSYEKQQLFIGFFILRVLYNFIFLFVPQVPSARLNT